MRTPIFTTLLTALAVLAAAPAFAKGPKLLVQDLVAQGVESHEAAAITTAVCTEVSKTKKYDTLCGDDLRNMMRFGALSASFDGCADAECYAGMAKALEARFVVSGKVGKLGKLYVLSLSMFDTQTGKPSGRSEIKAGTVEQLHTDAAEAVSALFTGR